MERYEIEELNPLQAFLLALVEFGLTTPYELLSKAGLGPGLTSPSLKRLEQAGLLTSTPGPRNRLRYAVTAKGASLLRASLRPGETNYWRSGQADIFESLPRGIILAWLYSGVDESHRGIARATEKLSVVAQKRQREAEELHRSLLLQKDNVLKDNSAAARGLLIATAYQWIKAESDAALFRLQADSVKHVDELLVELPPAPPLPRNVALRRKT
jgi:DNA-binding MarR family transcriptional regulator